MDEVPPEHPLELFAHRMLRRGSMTLESMQDMLQAIIQCLPQLIKARKRKCSDFSVAKESQSFSLTWGSYVIGGCGGVTRNTHNLPWLSRLLVAMVTGKRKEHIFSSVSLRLNTYMMPHLDKHNHPALPSLLVACGRWQGGGLWVSERALPQQSSGDMTQTWSCGTFLCSNSCAGGIEYGTSNVMCGPLALSPLAKGLMLPSASLSRTGSAGTISVAAYSEFGEALSNKSSAARRSMTSVTPSPDFSAHVGR